MKLVVAIVRPERLSAVLEELFRADVQGLTISRVQGHGGEREQVETYRGTTVKMELSEKMRLEIGVSNHFVERTVQAILKPRGPAASATARSSCCPSRRSTASVPVKKTGRGHAGGEPLGRDLQLHLNHDLHAVRACSAPKISLQLVLSEGEDAHQTRARRAIVHVASRRGRRSRRRLRPPCRRHPP